MFFRFLATTDSRCHYTVILCLSELIDALEPAGTQRNISDWVLTWLLVTRLHFSSLHFGFSRPLLYFSRSLFFRVYLTNGGVPYFSPCQIIIFFSSIPFAPACVTILTSNCMSPTIRPCLGVSPFTISVTSPGTHFPFRKKNWRRFQLKVNHEAHGWRSTSKSSFNEDLCG